MQADRKAMDSAAYHDRNEQATKKVHVGALGHLGPSLMDLVSEWVMLCRKVIGQNDVSHSLSDRRSRAWMHADAWLAEGIKGKMNT